MATQEDFMALAEMLGVTLSKESMRHVRSNDRRDESGTEKADIVVNGLQDGSDLTVWIVASTRTLIEEGEAGGTRKLTRVSEVRGEFERFYTSRRPPPQIDSKFVIWPDNALTYHRCPWLLET